MNHGMRFMTLYRRQGSRPSPWKRNAKKAKWLSEEALQIAVKRREAKKQRRKGKIYPFECRVPKNTRRDKKAFFSNQCKEMEENNRMGKTRDLFKKIKDNRGLFHANMSSVKGRNDRDLKKAEDIKKGWKEYTEELYKKDLHDPDSQGGVITHLEPNIRECEVKWALGNITMNKASGGDGIPVELF